MTRAAVFALGLFGLGLLTWLAFRTGGVLAALLSAAVLGFLLGWLFRLIGEWSEEAEYERRLEAMGRERNRFRRDSEDLEFRVAGLEKEVAAPAPAPASEPIGKMEDRNDSRRPDRAPEWWQPEPDGSPDDLTEIRGIGPVLSGMLNLVGVFHYRQVARFTRRDTRWIALRIRGFPARSARTRWRRQAKELMEREAITIPALPPDPRRHPDRRRA